MEITVNGNVIGEREIARVAHRIGLTADRV